ncbi:MAG: metallophosphoesterase [Oscillospiraceae bacterium]|nr:metallophosphoesterase [Oscillospiraceae bacterium]
MTIYAISDLHLPGADHKPMEIFGSHWADHFTRIAADWREKVTPEDVVLLPGDISWAMYLPEALVDLRAIAALPGRKVLLRGNHDFWWSSISRLRAELPGGMYALQNDALLIDDVLICGARGWLTPGAAGLSQEDQKIYDREVQRLKLSLEDGTRRLANAGLSPDAVRRVAMLHYPPFADKDQPTAVTALLAAHGVEVAVYGHLHGPGLNGAFAGEMDGVRYHLVSCDGLGFRLHCLGE